VKRRWRIGRLALIAGIAALAGCAAIFGIDDPARDPCADDACADALDGRDALDAREDATADAGEAASEDAADESPPDTGQDAPRPPNSIRCGDVAPTYCTGKTVCCESDDGDGGSRYACASEVTGCGAGYRIECSDPTRCPGGVCCHFHSGMKCVPATACSGEIVCDPNANDCPIGDTCSVPLTNDGLNSPYLGCSSQ